MFQNSYFPSKVGELETMQQREKKHALQINQEDNHALSKNEVQSLPLTQYVH